MRLRRAPLPLACLCLAAIAGCGGGGGSSTMTTAANLPSGCDQVAQPASKQVNLKAPPKQPPPGRLVATVDTSCGSFEIALDSNESPRTVASFAYLAKKHVYDDTTFHRIVPGFVIQGGDPLGTGTGGPGYFVDEPPPQNTAYTKGTVAMAKTQAEPPGRSGSQFFVVVAADAGLPPVYAVLGRVTRGMSTVARIARLGDRAAGPEGAPRAPVVIDNVTVNG
jgi:peptidyl-prolyl cis-trans isomerase B (cyclophilin B)